MYAVIHVVRVRNDCINCMLINSVPAEIRCLSVLGH